ncbi:MAG: DNA replication/repair protein RecF [Bacteroidota bacterium]|nr:DNA replication/repair protein RecF [Bacteroidota bacterium]
MYLERLHLLNFKNYAEVSLELSPGVNCFTGANGSGKTNLLDAIHYLSMTRSYFHPGDTPNIRHGEQMLFIQGDFNFDGLEESVYCGIRAGQKKQFKRNQKEYERLSDHIGAFPVVMIAPTDQELITEGSETRRKFTDSIISQYDHDYLNALIRYNQVLMQRNSLLKQSAIKGLIDWPSFAVWDEQLVAYGEKIYKKRIEFIQGFQPLFNSLFSFISGGDENAAIVYESKLNGQSFTELLLTNRSKDLNFQFTTGGIHKDDLHFNLRGYPAKKFASQGQQKSIVIALKLAHYKFLCDKGFSKPIVLLDDIFDKLDEGRVLRLMEWISRDGFGQLFITDSHSDRVAKVFHQIDVPLRLFHVAHDTVEIPATL